MTPLTAGRKQVTNGANEMSANGTQPRQAQSPRKRHRVFLWVYLAIQVMFLGWVIYAGLSLPQSGPSPGVGPQMGLWALTDVIIAAICGIRQLPRAALGNGTLAMGKEGTIMGADAVWRRPGRQSLRPRRRDLLLRVRARSRPGRRAIVGESEGHRIGHCAIPATHHPRGCGHS
jgi:hypothetical protein